MKAFAYHKPNSVPEAVALLADGSEIRPIAGGMSLLPTMKQRLAAPAGLIDLSGIAALKGIGADAETITIGAMTRHIDVARSAAVAKALPALAQLAGGIGDPAVRNRGTIGGSLANNDPAADYPAAILALGATIVTNTREIAADLFFRGMFETALEPGELITAVKLPSLPPPATPKCRTWRRASRWSACSWRSSQQVCASPSPERRRLSFECRYSRPRSPNASNRRRSTAMVSIPPG